MVDTTVGTVVAIGLAYIVRRHVTRPAADAAVEEAPDGGVTLP